ncbi:hypothetical protein H0H87_006026, partial [Tephrocybe sp. NHM501043]
MMVLPSISDSVINGVNSTTHDSVPQIEALSLGKGKSKELTILDKANAQLKMPAPQAKDAPEFKEETSPEILRKWVQHHAEQGSFQTKKDVDKYLHKFEELSNMLLEDQEITQNEANHYFFKGLPNPFHTHVFDKIPNGSGARVPNVDQQMKWIHQYFDKRALYDEVK